MNPDSKIFDLWPRAILILMAVFLLNVATAKAYEEKGLVDIEEINERVYLSCLPNAVLANDLLIFTLCNFERWLQDELPGAKIVVTSHLRKSQHHGDGQRANAIDFYIDNLPGGHCGNWSAYADHVRLGNLFLSNSGLIDTMGRGIYVDNKSYGSLVQHWDMRGSLATWAFVRDKQVGYIAGMRALNKIVQGCEL